MKITNFACLFFFLISKYVYKQQSHLSGLDSLPNDDGV